MPELTPPHRHLIPAYHQWLSESFETVHLYVNAKHLNDPFLADKAHEGVLVMNISPRTIVGFNVSDAGVSFGTRFGGQHYDVFLPNAGILGMMGFDGREPDQGFYVSMVEWPQRPERVANSTTEVTSSKPKTGPSLRVVK